jgi:hypothetical protein
MIDSGGEVMKKLFVGILFVQIIVFIVLLSLDSNPKSVIDSPYRNIDYSIRKDSPSQAVINQTNLLESDTAKSSSVGGLEEIKKKYGRLFGKLEENTSTKLMNLMVKVFDEYQEQGLNNQTLLSMTSYYKDFKDLEKETDQEFNKIYEELKSELLSKGYSTDEAVTFRQIYEQTKQKQLEKFLEQFKQQ